MKLKTWQKWGIAFGVVHVLVLMLYIIIGLLAKNKNIIECAYWVIVFLEAPIMYLYNFAKGPIAGDMFFYWLIWGTIFYFSMGVLFSYFVKLIARKTNCLTKVLIILSGMLIMVISIFLNSVIYYFKQRPFDHFWSFQISVYLFILGVFMIVLGGGSLKGRNKKFS